MTYETISVRMNRSDNSIRWGFHLRSQAGELIVDRVETESLSDKAGVKQGDKVESINGRPARGLDANSANRQIDDSYSEVRLALQRTVSSHTCLPWTLSEKDNKMIVEEVKPGFGSGFGHGFANGGSHLKHNTSSYSNNSSSYNHSSSYTNTNTHTNGGSNFNSGFGNGSALHNSSAPFGAHGGFGGSNNTAPFGANGGFGGSNFGNGSATHTTSTAPFTTSNYANNTYNSSNGYGNHTNAKFGGHLNGQVPIHQTPSNRVPFNYQQGANNYNTSASGYKSPSHHRLSPAPPTVIPTSYSFNNGVTKNNYSTSSSGGVPLNQQTFINTSNLGGAPGGLSPKIGYHSPGSRTRGELSPGASIHHLQYNSPMNLYSSETAAEQYSQQTGRQPEGPVPRNKTPVYLTSETKKLIEEEARGRNHRGRSPSSQSSCFKRIAHARWSRLLT